MRYHGSAVLALCSVASGDHDAYVHLNLNSWDFAAGALIAQEAGGTCTHLDGTPLDPYRTPQSLLVTNGLLHDQLLEMIQD